jgi:hypothetical protein
MARASIVREMSRVFGVYNIEVDIRHLELIADYMVSGNNQSELSPLRSVLQDFRGRLQAVQPQGN